MIHFDPHTRIFNLTLENSYYAFKVDDQERLVHLGWGLRPPGAPAHCRVTGGAPLLPHDNPALSFMVQFRPDEILTFGDVTVYQTTLKASFPALNQPLAEGEAAHLPIRDLRLRYVRHEIVTDARPGLAPQHGLPVQEGAPRQTLRVLLRDPVQDFFVAACYRLAPQYDIIERWLELENRGTETVTLDTCYSGTLHLPNGTSELTSLAGAWAREFTTQRERLAVGTRLIESRSLQTGHGANPFFMLNRPGQAWEQGGVVYFGALAYSGSWQIVVEQLPSWDVRVHGGCNPYDDRLQLAPGESYATPAWVTGVAGDGWGGASRRMHAYVQAYVLPRPPRENPHRPVLYNSWEAVYFDLDHEGQAALARKAAALGVELFCVDDGWFGARRSDHAGLGDWVVRQEAFPGGLEPLVAEIHHLGMKFGLWVEPEMVNPDSDLYRQHPDWVLHFPGRPRSQARNQLILDFGRDEVVEFIFGLLDELVRRYSISFFKWDMNRMPTEPGSAAGQAIWRKHVAGVYGIMDRLRARHPGLDIQSCSGGGGRVDLGILARTDQVWVSDNTDAFDRIRIQEGFSLAYPARVMEAWVTHAHNHQTGRITPLSLRFDVAMRGALGIGSNLNQLDEAELAEYAAWIAFYKRIRHIVQTGRAYRLERLEEFGASALEYVLPDGSEAVFSIAVEHYQIGSARPAALLRGMVPGAVYAVYDRYGMELFSASGYELMTTGMALETAGPVGYSRTLHIKVKQ